MVIRESVSVEVLLRTCLRIEVGVSQKEAVLCTERERPQEYLAVSRVAERRSLHEGDEMRQNIFTHFYVHCANRLLDMLKEQEGLIVNN